MTPTYLVGQLIRITVSVTDVATEVLVDPGVLTLTMRPPAQAAYTLAYGTDAEIQRLSTGIYYVDVALSAPGRWRWRWESATPNVGATEDETTVRASQV